MDDPSQQPAPPFLPSVSATTSALPGSGGSRAGVLDLEELAAVAADPTVTDLLVIGSRGVWVDRGRGLVDLPTLRLGEERARELATALVAAGDRHVDETTPCADVRLGDGIRVHVVLAPVSVSGTAISVRLPAVRHLGLDDLDRAGFFREVPRRLVEDAVHHRRNVLVSGATGSGKTTLLAAMLRSVPAGERIITVEDVAELRIDHPHVVALEARQPNAEGAGGIGLARLVRESLRMRPDRVVVGECRGAEVRELLSALNTGHDGGAGTVHANGLADVPARLEALGALAGLQPEVLARQVVSALDLVLHVERRRDGRVLAAAGRFALDEHGHLVVVDRAGLGPAVDPSAGSAPRGPGPTHRAEPRSSAPVGPGSGPAHRASGGRTGPGLGELSGPGRAGARGARSGDDGSVGPEGVRARPDGPGVRPDRLAARSDRPGASRSDLHGAGADHAGAGPDRSGAWPDGLGAGPDRSVARPDRPGSRRGRRTGGEPPGRAAGGMWRG